MEVGAVSDTNWPNVYASAKPKADQGFADALQTAAQKAQQAKADEKLKATCKDFEALFLNFMYTKMRETVPENTLYGTSHGEKIMQSMLDEEMTKNMANAGGIGLAAMMYKQLSMQSNNGKL